MTLPAEPGVDAPAWPLADLLDREATLWSQLWEMPQAFVWDKHHQALEVALYVRALVVAENPDAKAADRTVVRQLATELGLNESGRRANRWRFEEERVPSEETAPARPSVRDRLQMVPGGAA